MQLESLNIVAEVGAALAGFATLASVLRKGHRDRIAALGVVETSLIAVAFALLPRLLGSLRPTALLFFVVWTAATLIRSRQNTRATEGSAFDRSQVHPFLAVAGLITSLAGSVFSLLVVMAIWPEYEQRFYESAVICPLLISSFLLWLTVRNLVLADDDPAG